MGNIAAGCDAIIHRQNRLQPRPDSVRIVTIEPMKKLFLFALILATTSCSQFSPSRYADAAEEVAVARVNGLGEKHPNRVALEENMRSLASDDPSENQAAIDQRIRELEEETKRLRADGFNKFEQKADVIDVVIEDLKTLN